MYYADGIMYHEENATLAKGDAKKGQDPSKMYYEDGQPYEDDEDVHPGDPTKKQDPQKMYYSDGKVVEDAEMTKGDKSKG